MSTQALSAPISSLSLLLVQTQVARWKAATLEQLTGTHLCIDISKSGYLCHAVGNVIKLKVEFVHRSVITWYGLVVWVMSYIELMNRTWMAFTFKIRFSLAAPFSLCSIHWYMPPSSEQEKSTECQNYNISLILQLCMRLYWFTLLCPEDQTSTSIYPNRSHVKTIWLS